MQESKQGISGTGAIQPLSGLKGAFEESLRHSAMADIAELACFPTSRFDCDAEACKPAAPGAYFFVDYGTESGTYFRCDTKGCDSYPVTVKQSGSFTQFIPEQGQAMLFKVLPRTIRLEIKGSLLIWQRWDWERLYPTENAF